VEGSTVDVWPVRRRLNVGHHIVFAFSGFAVGSVRLGVPVTFGVVFGPAGLLIWSAHGDAPSVSGAVSWECAPFLDPGATGMSRLSSA
jgi:hypothetical protein